MRADRDTCARRDLRLQRPSRPGSQDCAAWRHLDGLHAPAIEHHEPVTMAGAKHARVFRERFDESLDDSFSLRPRLPDKLTSSWPPLTSRTRNTISAMLRTLDPVTPASSVVAAGRRSRLSPLGATSGEIRGRGVPPRPTCRCSRQPTPPHSGLTRLLDAARERVQPSMSGNAQASLIGFAPGAPHRRLDPLAPIRAFALRVERLATSQHVDVLLDPPGSRLLPLGGTETVQYGKAVLAGEILEHRLRLRPRG